MSTLTPDSPKKWSQTPKTFDWFGIQLPEKIFKKKKTPSWFGSQSSQSNQGLGVNEPKDPSGQDDSSLLLRYTLNGWCGMSIPFHTSSFFFIILHIFFSVLFHIHILHIILPIVTSYISSVSLIAL
jgi:hypothetical protein